MLKRGQVSVFIIIGIVAIFAIVFVFLLFRGFQEKAREIINPEDYLKSQIGDIKKSVDNCIDDNTLKTLNKLYLQGGYLEPTRYIEYYGNKVSFLCYKIKDNEPCYNMMFTNKEIEDQLKNVLNTEIKNCVDDKISSFRNKDYSLVTGELNLDVVFNANSIFVTVNYPVKLSKGNFTDIQEKFSKSYRTNLWQISDIALSIINNESRGQDFDVVNFSINNYDFEVGKNHIKYGDLYIIKSRNTQEPAFYFGVEK